MGTTRSVSSEKKIKKSYGGFLGVVPIYCSDPEDAMSVSEAVTAARFSRFPVDAEATAALGNEPQVAAISGT